MFLYVCIYCLVFACVLLIHVLIVDGNSRRCWHIWWYNSIWNDVLISYFDLHDLSFVFPNLKSFSTPIFQLSLLLFQDGLVCLCDLDSANENEILLHTFNSESSVVFFSFFHFLTKTYMAFHTLSLLTHSASV